MRFGHAFATTIALAAVWGCGGGAGRGTTSSANPIESNFAAGDLAGRAAISNPPLTTNSAYVAATALTGTISSLKLRALNPTLAETRIFYDSNAGDLADIYSVSPDGSGIQRLTTAPQGDIHPSASASGKVAFVSSRDGNPEIYIMNGDGSGQTRLTTHAAIDTQPSISADGTKVAFLSNRGGSYQPHVVDVASKVVTLLTIETAESVEITPNGSLVYFTHNNGSDYHIRVVSATGGTSSLVLISPEAVRNFALSPDGSEIAIATTGASNDTVTRHNLFSSKRATYVMPGWTNGLSYSPDGQQLVVASLDATTSVGLYLVSLSGSMTRITNKMSDSRFPSWGSFVRERTLIAGGGGTLGTRAVGLVYGQKGSATTSVVTFDATTPSSVVMTRQTPNDTNSPNLIFSADADSIIKMAFANGNAWQGIRIIGSGTPVLSANGALISIDSYTGQVVSILPFIGTRASGSRPTVHDKGSTRVFQGQFLAVYDRAGKNLAPNGATTVRLNVSTGAISVD